MHEKLFQLALLRTCMSLRSVCICSVVYDKIPSTIYKVSTLLGPTALLQNDGTLYPDTSPPTDNSLATNHRPFPGLENRFSIYYGLPSFLFHCLLRSVHTPWTHCIASECWHTLPRHLSTHGQLTCH